jgi:uncharacterized surface protein with fasciclin (FAS1) repeats
MKRIATPALATAAVLAFAPVSLAGDYGSKSCDSTATKTMASQDKAHADAPSIVATADQAGMFNTLLAAAKQAGLAETLDQDGPFTVLAPTDEAFAKLPQGTVESLLKPENKDTLKSILLYHVIEGEVKAEKVVTLDEAPTLQGTPVDIEANDNGVMVNGANVIKTDIQAGNGVIHVIDTVLIPSGSASAAESDANAG